MLLFKCQQGGFMDNESIRECNEIVNMFETTLFALKWQAKDETGWKYQPVISEYEYILNKVSDVQAYRQCGNSVVVPLITAVSEQLVKTMLSKQDL